MNKKLAIIIGVIVIAYIGYLLNPSVVNIFGGGDGFTAYDCATNSSTQVTVNPSTSSTILAAHSRRAWASVGITGTSTQGVYVSIDEGAAAVVGQGRLLAGTTTPEAIVGLNTDLPYTGAITGITTAGTTTVLVTECRY